MAAGESKTFTEDYTIETWNSGNQFINTVTVTAYDPQENVLRDDDSATVTRRTTGGGGGGGGTPTTTTIVEPEPIPQGTPEVIHRHLNRLDPVILEEAVPLGVPVLPKTGVDSEIHHFRCALRF